MKILAVDGNSVLYRAFYGLPPLSNKAGVYTNAIVGFMNMLQKLEKTVAPDQTILAFDVKEKTFRHHAYDAYKGNRKPMPEELVMQLQPLRQMLTYLGYPIITQAGYEADDILGTISALATAGNHHCVIATGDRDALQLIAPQVEVCLMKKNDLIRYDEATFVEQYGITPKQFIDVKALMGDPSDHIPGIKGIGEKTAVSLIQAATDLEGLYRNLDQIKMTPRIRKMLADGESEARMSQMLATICLTVPLEQPLKSFVRTPMQKEALSSLLTELELVRLREQWGLSGDNLAEPPPVHPVAVLDDPTAEQWGELLASATTLDFVWEERSSDKPKKGESLLCDRLLVRLADTVVVLTEQAEDRLMQEVFSSPLPKRTLNTKPHYKRALREQSTLENVTLDVEIAAYLLDPARTDYALPQLVASYLPEKRYEVPEPWRADHGVCAMAHFSALCDVLVQELQEQGMWRLYTEIEQPLCAVLAQMELSGFAVDRSQITAYGEAIAMRITALKEEIIAHAGHPFNLNSTQELGVILFEQLGLPKGKKTKTGYSTNAEVLEGLRGSHPIIDPILEYRKLTKLQATYVVGLLKLITPDGRIHSTFHQTQTRTGRLSSSDPNLQNIPIRTEEGRQMRHFFVAKEGYLLVDADYSQIELRILAHIAKDEAMIAAFAAGEDIHQMTASQVFRTPFSQVTSEQRSRAKAINFGIVYGIGAYSLSQDINTSVLEAQAYIDAYLETYPRVRDYMEQVVEQAKRDGYLTTLYGRRRNLAEIHSPNKIVQANAKRIALNTPIQGAAADIMKIAMIRVADRLREKRLDATLILQVHDELIVEARDEVVPAVSALLRQEMESAATLATPLSVDLHVGATWHQAKG